jgi:Holliday junction resolvase-like predicted endonuclease
MLGKMELDTEAFGSKLDWNQFEGLAELAFRSFGYKTIKNFRIKKPRTEIDLVASSGKIRFAVDCKHWKRTVGMSTMISISERQIKRSELLLATVQEIEKIIPVILTLHDEQLRILPNGVPIVPIQKLSDFILNWDSPTNGIRTINKSSSSSKRKRERR